MEEIIANTAFRKLYNEVYPAGGSTPIPDVTAAATTATVPSIDWVPVVVVTVFIVGATYLIIQAVKTNQENKANAKNKYS